METKRRLFGVLGLGLIATVLHGCGTLPLACTEIGCQSGVTFALGEHVSAFEAGQSLQLRACVDDACATDSMTLTPREPGEAQVFMSQQGRFEVDVGAAQLRFVGGQEQFGDGEKTVSLQVTKDGNVTVDETREGVTFERSQPNGPGCEPICWNANVTL